MPILLATTAALSSLLLLTDTPDANEIMKRMAASVEASIEARRHYVYSQTVKARLLRPNSRVARQETRKYTAAPGVDRTEKTLVSLQGEYHKSTTEIIKYDKPGFEKGGLDIDGDLLRDLVDELVNDKKSRDGIPHDLFPLSTKDLPAYTFTFKDQTEVKGRKAYAIAFQPAHKSMCVNLGGDDDCGQDRPWKGEVLVDAEEFQPVRIYTDLAFKMPWGVKVFLGTNIRQVGFSVAYSRLEPNVWFPVSYGTEFKLDVLFGYHRVITLALDSTDFRRGEAKSEIRFATPE